MCTILLTGQGMGFASKPIYLVLISTLKMCLLLSMFFYSQRSLDAYFGAKKSGGISVLTDGDEPQIILNIK